MSLVPIGASGALYLIFVGFFVAIGWAFGSWFAGLVLGLINQLLAKR
jgi:hypothetical protein